MPSVRGLDAAAVVLAVAVSVTCAAGVVRPSAGRAPPAADTSRTSVSAEPDPQPAPASASVALPAPSSSVTAAAALGSAQALEPRVEVPAVLQRFGTALGELAAGRRKDPVRVLFLGDSHTAADFWTDTLRERLQARFGAGGPGFVSVGLEHYRHAGVSIANTGKWSRSPAQPTSHQRQGDGVYGLSGLSAAPASSDARATITVSTSRARGALRGDLMFRAPTSRFRLTAGARERKIDGSAGKLAPGGSVRHYAFTARAGEAIELSAFEGAPELFGVVLETERPGVVVDTLGINGARASTALAWDEAAWGAEVALRAPALFVIAYGTNDIPSSLSVEAQTTSYRALVARLRAAVPAADCAFVGPTDLARSDGTSHPRGAEIDLLLRSLTAEIGCAYFSVIDTMGGDGSMKRWQDESPPLAQRDGIHLTPQGYERVGRALALALVGPAAATDVASTPHTP